MASANSYSIQSDSGAKCSRNEDKGPQMELGAAFNEDRGGASVSIKYVFQLGQKKANKINCRKMYSNVTKKQDLELIKLEMEIELLRKQIAKQGAAGMEQADDW